jgi:hypothetical protein
VAAEVAAVSLHCLLHSPALLLLLLALVFV